MSDVEYAPRNADITEIERCLGRKVPDYQRVVHAAQDVLRDGAIVDPPVLPKQIAESYGLQVKFVTFSPKFSSVSGFLDLDAMTIFVNSADPPNRQTFTIAHEFGHAKMHADLFRKHPEDYQVLLRSPIGAVKDPLESEANTFAANLLVPKPFLDRFYKVATVRDLASLFIVSEDVIRYRIQFEYKNEIR